MFQSKLLQLCLLLLAVGLALSPAYAKQSEVRRIGEIVAVEVNCTTNGLVCNPITNTAADWLALNDAFYQSLVGSGFHINQQQFLNAFNRGLEQGHIKCNTVGAYTYGSGKVVVGDETIGTLP
jgi:hypothetical protein